MRPAVRDRIPLEKPAGGQCRHIIHHRDKGQDIPVDRCKVHDPPVRFRAEIQDTKHRHDGEQHRVQVPEAGLPDPPVSNDDQQEQEKKIRLKFAENRICSAMTGSTGK